MDPAPDLNPAQGTVPEAMELTIPPAAINTVPFFNLEIPSYSDFPVIRIADGAVTFESETSKQRGSFPIEGHENIKILAVPIEFHYDRGGSYSGDDYWRISDSYQVIAHFIVSDLDGVLSHIATIAAVPLDKVEAVELDATSSKPRPDSEKSLRRFRIPATLKEVEGVTLDGMTLDEAKIAISGLRKIRDYERLEVKEIEIRAPEK